MVSKTPVSSLPTFTLTLVAAILFLRNELQLADFHWFAIFPIFEVHENIKIMKQLLFAGLVLMVVSCAAPTESGSKEQTGVPDGAYSLEAATWTYSEDSVVEIYPDQIKIYAAGKYMFATMNPLDGSVSSGAGNMSQEGSVITETPLFSAAGAVEEGMSFSLNITETEGGFEQHINQLQFPDGSTVDLRETWKRLSDGTGAYDGLWKLTSRNEIDGVNNFQEIKMIGGGHFVWYHTWSDSIEHKDFGYGEFVEHGDGAVTEVAQIGSIEDYAGEWNITYQLLDNDHLQQTYVSPDSVEVVQSYERQ